jgi:NAD(P)-dependent dehydrogenase (short-subunit alcohol dehydrogenase family)
MTPASLFSESPEEVYKQWGIPTGRQGSHKDYAQAVLYFASNEYTTGSTLLIDGS